jgi:DNA-binding transcriptional LysR family regulator
MTLQQLKYLIEVANKGSINKAAKSLFISQPSLSNAIKDIEDELHIDIFKRTNKGIRVTIEGAEFLGYARQIVEQAELLEEKYKDHKPSKQKFSVSTQHCAVTVIAFGELIKKYGSKEYEFELKETKSVEVINDVINNKSEIGIIYINEFNEMSLRKKISEGNLEFKELFAAKPYVLVSSDNALTKKKKVTLKDLEHYPCFSFGQEEYNLFHFSEEVLSTMLHKKNIRVSERATLFNLLTLLNGFTISTGIISERLKKQGIVPIDLEINNIIKIGVVTKKTKSQIGENFIKEMKKVANSML